MRETSYRSKLAKEAWPAGMSIVHVLLLSYTISSCLPI